MGAQLFFVTNKLVTNLGFLEVDERWSNDQCGLVNLMEIKLFFCFHSMSNAGLTLDFKNDSSQCQKTETPSCVD